MPCLWRPAAIVAPSLRRLLASPDFERGAARPCVGSIVRSRIANDLLTLWVKYQADWRQFATKLLAHDAGNR